MTENGNENGGKVAFLMRKNGEGFTVVETFEPNEDYKSPVRMAKAFLNEVASDTDHELYRPLYDQQLYVVNAKGLEPIKTRTQTTVL